MVFSSGHSLKKIGLRQTRYGSVLFSTLYLKFGESMLIDGPIKKALNKTQMTNMSFQKTTDEIDLVELDNWYTDFVDIRVKNDLAKGIRNE